ncbi:NB-ARC domain-containing protein [Embleya sp. AB8]|uniref:NB-ARC domain-containing protein n=1 Tax=Embleya sp. AB8 TaxID=3156304 RepID=UPI003C71F5F4
MNITYHQAPHPGPTPRTPHQVPACAAVFVNRTAHLSGMDGWLVPPAADSPRIAVLSGLPGVGKRSIARRWTENMRDRFPGGDLHVDYSALRDRAGGDVSEGLAKCLRSLGVAEEYLPATLDERAALFRTLTAEQRVLVVLDAVTEPAQVSALVPRAPGSAVLVTSNRALDELRLDGARLMPLPPLDAVAGRHLLAALCGEERVRAEPEAADRLVELCAGLPVALHVVAARLAHRRRPTMADLAAELADEKQRLAGLSMRGERTVSAVFTLAYRDLPSDAARLYRRLGLLPGRTFDVPTAAVAADVEQRQAQDLLDVLDGAGLLDEPATDGRYALHELARLHARDCAGQDEPEGAGEALLSRVVEHYLTCAAFADRAVMGERLRIADHRTLLRERTDPFAGGDARTRALAWLTAERADALAVLRAAAEHGGLDRQVWQLAEAMVVLYLHHRHLADWIETCTLGAQAAAAQGDPAAEARLRSMLSRPLLDTDQPERARAELTAAVAGADESGHPVLRASVLEFLGRYWDRIDPARAVEVYRQSIALNKEAGEERGAALAIYFMGCAQDASGDRRTASATLQDAVDRLRAVPDARMTARALASLGRVQDRLGDSTQAARTLREAIAGLRKVEASHYEAQALESLADIEERAGDRAAVPEHLNRAYEIYAAGGSPRAAVVRERLDATGDSTG